MKEKVKTGSEIIKVEKIEKDETSAESLIQQAILSKVPVETLERLLAMRTQIKAEKALEAFNQGMAEFQASCPTIIKTKEVFTRDGRSAYKFAPLESIVAQTKGIIRKCGFSYSFRQELKDTGVKVICKVVHSIGHFEEFPMEVPFGSKTQIMSDSQVTAAATTFAKRYAFCNAFGILTGDEDNDAIPFDTSPIKDDAVPTVTYDDHEETPITIPDDVTAQRKRIFSLLMKRGVDVKDTKACRVAVADETQLELEEKNFPEIIKLLSK